MSSTTKRRRMEGKNTFPTAVITDSKKYRTVDYGKFSIVKETIYSSVRPYHFHQISGTRIEIRSAGPDGQVWTEDDLLLSPQELTGLEPAPRAN